MKILIAEDESGIADTYQRFLEGRGHQVTLTKDGMQCVKAYKQTMAKLPDKSEEYLAHHLPFDAVVLDYKMPTMDGLGAAKLILEANKHQRIIFASAYVMSTLQESVKHLHMVVELVQKPFELDELVDLIEDKHVYEELRKINVKIKKIKEFNPTHEQLIDLLHGLRGLRTKKALVR